MIPIAERVLTADDGRSVTVAIHVPEPDPDPTGDWRCEVRVQGAVNDQHWVHGLDGMSALENAFQFIRKTLDDSGLVLSWAGGEPGDHGVSRVVPGFLGRAFARDIEEEIDRRMAALGPKLMLRSLDALMQRIDAGAPYDELVETLNAIASAPGADDPQVAEALQKARSMLDASRPPAKP
jgi:hypothetical protein